MVREGIRDDVLGIFTRGIRLVVSGRSCEGLVGTGENGTGDQN